MRYSKEVATLYDHTYLPDTRGSCHESSLLPRKKIIHQIPSLIITSEALVQHDLKYKMPKEYKI